MSRDLLDDEAELVVGREEVRPDADARARPEVAEYAALLELGVHGGRLGDVDDHGAAASRRFAHRMHPEARAVRELDEELRLAQRVLTDALDADLLDQVVAGRAREVGRGVRRPGEEARGAARVHELLLERERALVGLPARVGGPEPLGEIRAHVQPPVARPSAEPLHAPADGEVTSSAVTSSGTIPADW